MKKAFTLIELLLVVLVLWVLMWAMKNMFSYENVNRLKYDTCYLKTYWFLSNFNQQALLQKSVRTWDVLTWVNQYEIIFDNEHQKIEFIYSWASSKKVFNYSWDWTDIENDCYNTTYHTKIWDWNLKVIMQPGFQTTNATGSLSPMQIYSWDNFNTAIPNSWTWEIIFYYCKWTSDAQCSELNKIVVEPKVQMFKTFFCKSLDDNREKCDKWSE